MKIRDSIQSFFQKKLKREGCLVVYDSEQRFRELLVELESEECHWVDASQSVILGREKATRIWMEELPQHPEEQLLIYLPIPKPIQGSPEQLSDPYQIFALGGGVYPEGDSESYLELCLQCKESHKKEVEELFQETNNPDFELIDSLEEGKKWPRLRKLLAGEAEWEIFLHLLVPNTTQKKNLKRSAWVYKEVPDFFQTLFHWTIPPEVEKWEELQQHLWQFALFSEFVLDLPVDLPDSLKNLPVASPHQQELIYKVCDQLRQNEQHQGEYLEQAQKIEERFSLPTQMKGVEHFGVRDTFPFEEKACLRLFLQSLKVGKMEECQELYRDRQNSVWVKHTERKRYAKTTKISWKINSFVFSS